MIERREFITLLEGGANGAPTVGLAMDEGNGVRGRAAEHELTPPCGSTS